MQHFVESEVESELLFDNGHQDVDRDRHPDLRLDGVLGGAVKGFDAQVLFDPAEELLAIIRKRIFLNMRPGEQGKLAELEAEVVEVAVG